MSLREQGFTRKEITEQLGITRNFLDATLAQMIKLGYVHKINKEEAARRRIISVYSNKPSLEKLIELDEKGFTTAKIATMTGTTQHYVASMLKPIRAKRRQQFNDKLINLYISGMPYKDIAVEMDRSLGQIGVMIYRLAKQGKIKLRKA
jgi:DNA-binding MarR family transcriptional regulator